MRPSNDMIAALLYEVAHAAYMLCDDSWENASADHVLVDKERFAALSDALDELDELPQPYDGKLMTGPMRAIYYLQERTK